MAYTTIDKPTDYFNTVLYSGTGSNQSITGVGFQPDLIWGKGRTLVGYDHRLVDIVRGNTKLLKSNSADAEETQTTEIQSFDSDGFTVGTGSRFNNASQTYVAWNWLADNTSGSSNTDGSITSSVSANTTSGFSIVSYTGTGANATVGHGIDTPKMIIVKGRNKAGGSPWWVYHSALGNTKGLTLNTTDASSTFSVLWNNTSPTSSVFSLGTGDEVNQSGTDFIAYCFAEKKGFSKFGSYTGNGSTDGTFIYTGFRPAWVVTKSSSNLTHWNCKDNKRSTFNTVDDYHKLNEPTAEDTGVSSHAMDFLSNGFKHRGNNDEVNGSGRTYIYMAFAENPFVSSSGVPCTAR